MKFENQTEVNNAINTEVNNLLHTLRDANGWNKKVDAAAFSNEHVKQLRRVINEGRAQGFRVKNIQSLNFLMDAYEELGYKFLAIEKEQQWLADSLSDLLR